MGDRLEQLGQETVRRVVDLVGDEKHCRAVNSGARSLVQQLVKDHADSQTTSVLGRAAGGEVEKVCRAMTPEGRSIVILTGATAAVVYAVIHWDELEPDIAQALRRATVPIKVPLGRIGRPNDELTLSAGLERLELEYNTELGNGRLSVYGGYDFERDRGEVGFRYELLEW